MRGQPPHVAAWVVAKTLHRVRSEIVLGDLAEGFVARLDSEGYSAARRWYWRSAAASVVAEVRHRLWEATRSTGRARTTHGFLLPMASTGDSPVFQFLADFRLSVRNLRRRPLYSSIVVLTLALGIGATTAIYSVVNILRDQAFPYPDSERVHWMFDTFIGQSGIAGWSYLNAVDLQERSQAFEILEMSVMRTMRVTGTDEPLRLDAIFVNGPYFDMLGARPHLGRLFGPEDAREPGGHAVAILSFEIWTDAFGSDPGIIGTTVQLGGLPYSVVGVVEPGVYPPPGRADLYLPVMQYSTVHPQGEAVFTDRSIRFWIGNGRLAAGVTLEEAERDLDRVWAQLRQEHPAINEGVKGSFFSLGTGYRMGVIGPLMVLLAGAGVLLLIGCFNVASLQLVRGASRVQEMALRRTLGARRSVLVRYLVTESFVLAAFGGAVGVLVAHVALPVLIAMRPSLLPYMTRPSIDSSVLLVSFAVTLIAGALSGVLPALRTGSTDLRTSLSQGGRSGPDRKGSRVRSGLIVAEVATAMVLLSSSALLIRGFQSLRAMDVGFVTDDVVITNVEISTTKYASPEEQVRVAQEIRVAAAALPEISWAEIWAPGRPGLAGSRQTVVPEGTVVETINEAAQGARHVITPDAFESLGVAVVRGRGFEVTDDLSANRVAVVSETLASIVWPDQDPIGRRFHGFTPIGTAVPESEIVTVVGVVSDARHVGRLPSPLWMLTANQDVYLPLAQRPETSLSLVVRSATFDVGRLGAAVRAIDPDLALFDVSTIDALFASEEGPARFAASLMGAFAVAALLLSALGVYGVLSYSVSLRRREIGVRTALGAQRRDTLLHFVRSGMTLGVVGAGVGLFASWFLQAPILTFAFEGTEASFFATVLAAVVLVLVSLIACLVPAYRATQVAPSIALSEESA